jgi:hypothetical protein
MNKYSFLVLVLICLLGSFFTQSQAQSSVRVFVSAPNPIIEIDHNIVEHGAVILLRPGEHTIQVWAPKHEIVDSVFISYADSLTILKFKLELNEPYKAYKEKRNASRFLPYTLVAAGATVSYFYGRNNFLKPARQALVDSDAYYKIYSESYNFQNVQEARANFDESQLKYNKMRNRYYFVNGATILVAAASSYLIYRHQVKKKKMGHQFEEERLLGLQSIGVGGVESVALGINLKFYVR